MVYNCQNEVTMKPNFINNPIIYRNFAVTGYHTVHSHHATEHKHPNGYCEPLNRRVILQQTNKQNSNDDEKKDNSNQCDVAVTDAWHCP
jgi:hypothetical protein